MRKSRRGGSRAVATLVVFLVILGGCSRPRATTAEQVLRVGFLQDPLATLLYVAESTGSFSRHGLRLQSRTYEGGAYALRDLQAGTLDIAAATEYALVRRSFQDSSLRTFASIATAENVDILVRADSGISRGADLRGRRIGVSAGMNTRYILGTFLALNGMDATDVRLELLTPSQIVAGLQNGTLDAGCIYPPFTEVARATPGQVFTAWPAQVHQDYFYVLVAGEPWIRANPALVEALLRSLLDAESYLKAHPAEAGRIVAQATGVPPEELPGRWRRMRARVSLDEEMVTLMEDEARWIRSQSIEGEGEIPNVFSLVHFQPLERLKPSAVGIIH